MTWKCGHFLLSYHGILVISSVSFFLSPVCHIAPPLPLQLGSRLKGMIFKEFLVLKTHQELCQEPSGPCITGSSQDKEQTPKAWLSSWTSSTQSHTWPWLNLGSGNITIFFGGTLSRVTSKSNAILAPGLKREVSKSWSIETSKENQKQGWFSLLGIFR